MSRILFVALGGAVGSVARYMISGIDPFFSHDTFPVRTVIVNVTGALVIGLLWGVFERFTISEEMRSFLFIGVLGGYTTFSTFSLETFNLLRDGDYRIATTNVLLSVLLSVAGVFLGYLASKPLMTFFK